MYGGMANLAVPCGGSFMPLPPSGVQQMPREWLMRQQLSMGSNPMITPASRAYHLEPLSVLPTSQHGNQSPPLQGQPQGLYPGSMKMMLNGMCMPMQHGQMVVPQQPQKMGMPCIGGYGAPGMRGPQSNSGAGYGSGNFGAMASPSNSSNLGGVGGATYGLHGNDAGTGDWNQINGQGMFQCSGEAQMQNAVKEDDGRPLPFPPGHLLAQYPPVYQQQMIFYYRMLRLQYPDLYQQYMDYYETFYEPLYNPRSPTPEVKEYHAPPPRNKICSPLQPVAPPQLQPVHYLPPSMPEPPRKTEDLQRSNSTLGISRQSSMRRQNSMRRAEVNQLKNEGGLKRLPSMPWMPATSGMDAPLMEEDSANMSASSYCDPVYINSTTEAPAGALADDESSRDPPSPLLRKGSSFRLLRRKVSFTGVPSTLPPEVEPRSSPWTPKRMGSRRLSGSSSSVEDANTEVTQTQRQYKDEATQCDEQQVAQYSGRASPYAGPPFQYGQLQPPPTYYVRQQVQQLAESSEKASEAPQPGEGEGSQQSGNAVNQTNWAQLQPTLARSSLSGSSRRGSFSRRNSMITLPYHANRLPNEYRPSMPNCIMTTFPCPVYRPTFPPLRSAPFGAYSANRTTY